MALLESRVWTQVGEAETMAGLFSKELGRGFQGGEEGGRGKERGREKEGGRVSWFPSETREHR